MPLKVAIVQIGWVAASVWLTVTSSPLMYALLIFAHRSSCQHRVSTVSWFCCRFRCRLVSNWCWVSLVPLELRCQSPPNQSLIKLPSPPRKAFPIGDQVDLNTTPPHCPVPHCWLCTFTQGPKMVANLHDETHMQLTSWHFAMSLSDNTEDYLLLAILGNKRMSVIMYTLHRIISLCERRYAFIKISGPL